MSSKKSSIYIRKTSKDGEQILCPIDDNGDKKIFAKDDLEDCVEQDVVGRYAGNIEVQSASVPKNT